EGLLFRHGGTVCHSPGSAIGGNDPSLHNQKAGRRNFSRISGQIGDDNSTHRGNTWI
ncbi:hypothetical protein NPIL_335351, partial [Nephila pilipes]